VAICSWRVADTEGVSAPDFVRRAGLWRVVFDWVGFFDFTSSLPCDPSRIRSVTERLGRPWGGVKGAGYSVWKWEAIARVNFRTGRQFLVAGPKFNALRPETSKSSPLPRWDEIGVHP